MEPSIWDSSNDSEIWIRLSNVLNMKFSAVRIYHIITGDTQIPSHRIDKLPKKWIGPMKADTLVWISTLTI